MRSPKITRNESGATAVEFALLFWVLLFVTLGIIEFGRALFEWNRAEKALQFGARLAVVSDPIADGLKLFSGKTNANQMGDPCADASGNIQTYCRFDPDPVICTSGGCNGYGFSSLTFNRIVARMQEIDPSVQAENVVVEYRSTELGFVGRPGSQAGNFNLVPAVTVRLRNMSLQFLVLDDLFGFGDIPMPEFATTLIGEDLSTVTDT